MFGMVYAWGGIAPVVYRETGWSIASLDLMFSLTPLTLFPAILAGGWLIGHYPPERVLMGACVCFAAGTLAGLSSDSPWTFSLCYACLALGVGGGLSTPASIQLVNRVASRAHGRFSGALLAVYCLSATINVPLFLCLARHESWRVALGILATAWCILGVLALVALPRSPRQTKLAANVEAVVVSDAGLGTVTGNIVLLFACVPFGSAAFAEIGRLASTHGSETWLGVVGTAAISITNSIGRLAGGALSDFLSPGATWCVVLGFAMSGYLAIVAETSLGSPSLFMLFAALTGLAFGSVAGKLPALAASTAPTRPARAFSIYFGAFALASFAGPLVSATIGISATLTLFGCATVAAFTVTVVRTGLSRRSVPGLRLGSGADDHPA